MDIFFVRTIQLLLSISLLVLLHEFGHFITAKLFRIRVEKFALFFDPWRSLLKFKPKNSTTTYVLGWLPLGGYVKISGMVDESMDENQISQSVKPWEFRSKPAWQRLIVMLAGITMNVLVAFIIYAMILFTWGKNYIPIENIKDGFEFNTSAKSLGFENGDIPISVDGTPLERFDDMQSVANVYRKLSSGKNCEVLRKGCKCNISLPGNMSMIKMMQEQPPFLMPYNPSVVKEVQKHSPADIVGILPGDRIIEFNHYKIDSWPQFMEVMNRINDVLAQKTHDDSLRVRNINLIVQKKTGTLDSLSIRLTADYKLGIIWQHPFAKCKIKHEDYGFFESFPAGVKHGWEILCGYIVDLKYVFTSEGAKSIGSFGTIGSLFPAQWDWYQFWNLTAFISLMLAFVNLLPIPALDGGHAFFLLYEIITRKKPNDSFMMKMEQFGLLLLLLLMLYAIFNDIMRFVF